jgi:hypothetical protein
MRNSANVLAARIAHWTVLIAAIVPAGCGGGSVSAGPPASAGASWLAVLRANPTDLHLSLSNPALQYMYVDSGSTNGVYPSPSAFAAQIEAANPSLLSGSCSAIARMTAATMQFTDSHGVQAPSYVVFFAPLTAGSCSQAINLGAEGTQRFSVTVTT